jgi:ADP-ribose pyrophosphatase YjhB (NUDIX family)
MDRFRAPVAVHLLLTRGDEVLLLRRFNTGYEDGNFSVPAGHLDGGETAIEAGAREAREEIGVEIAVADLQIVQVMHRFAEDERIDYFVTANRWEGEIRNREPEKCDLLAWHRIDALPGNTISYIAYAIRCWREGAAFTTFGVPEREP